MSLKDAILEVNYWCAENGTYHSSDSRTASALTVYKTGLGRCGEVSVGSGSQAPKNCHLPSQYTSTQAWLSSQYKTV